MLKALNSNTLQARIDVLMRYRWVGILVFLVFISPLLYLLLAITPIGLYLPDTIHYQGESAWEMILGILLTLLLALFLFASIFRAYENRQRLWLVFMLLVFPSALLYMLFANTRRHSN